MIEAYTARARIVLAMLLVRSRSLVWMVYPLLLLETVMVVFFEPARNSVIPNIARREDVILANTLSSATWSVNLLVTVACLFVMLAHCGGSTIWVFSTTLLQLHTDDRFRGRVFTADLSFCMLTIAVGAYLCGLFLDWGVSTRVVEIGRAHV